MRITPVKIVSAASMATTVTSAPQQTSMMFSFNIQAVFTTVGTLTGTFKLQQSTNHDFQGNGADGAWDDVANSSITISAAGSLTWNYESAIGPWVRLVYTPGMSDTGSLDAFFYGRGF